MKKMTLILVLMMAVLAVNAQVSRVAVKPSDLPKGITDNVAKSYAGYAIKDATKVIENNVTTFDVIISRGVATETLIYDKDGKFLRKAPAHTAAAHAGNTGMKHETKSTPVKK